MGMSLFAVKIQSRHADRDDPLLSTWRVVFVLFNVFQADQAARSER